MRSISFRAQLCNAVKDVSYPIIPYKIALFARKSNISRLTYNEYIKGLNCERSHRSSQTHIERKWHRDIGCMHEGSLHGIRLSTNNTYLQTFHYRIVSRIISTNTFLHRIGKSGSPLCTFCKACNETLFHILWNCALVQDFIENLKTHLFRTFNISINFTAQSWFFPRLKEESQINILIITIAKVAIFKAKYQEHAPNLQHFPSLVKIEAQNEKECAILSKQKEKFAQK